MYGPTDESDSLRLLVEAGWRNDVQCAGECDRLWLPETHPEPMQPINIDLLESMRTRAAVAAGPASADRKWALAPGELHRQIEGAGSNFGAGRQGLCRTVSCIARSKEGPGARRQGICRTVSFADKVETQEIPADRLDMSPSIVSKPEGIEELPEEPAKCFTIDSVLSAFLTPFQAGAGGHAEVGSPQTKQYQYGNNNLLAMRSCTLPGIGSIRR